MIGIDRFVAAARADVIVDTSRYDALDGTVGIATDVIVPATVIGLTGRHHGTVGKYQSETVWSRHGAFIQNICILERAIGFERHGIADIAVIDAGREIAGMFFGAN